MNLDQDIRIGEDFKMIPYNTGEAPMVLPGYGRTIQQMVDYCVMIPDREERTACAYAIVDVMRTLFQKNITDRRDLNKFWDHLNMMARYELDIDFPCEVASREQMRMNPQPIPYSSRKIQGRQYGKYIEMMIEKVAEMEDSQERQDLIVLIANQMKKQLVARNPESADNHRVYNDFNRLSHGKITVNEENCPMSDYKEYDDPTKPQKSKKKKFKNLI